MKSWKRCLLSLGSMAAVLALFATSAMCADKSQVANAEQEITKKELPPAVLKAFEKAYPKAVINGVAKETDSTTDVYEIESTNNGARRTLIYLADGTLREIEAEIAPAGLPEAARKTIANDYPNGKIQKVERVTKGSVTTFEALVVSGKAYTELVFDSTGKLVRSEKKAVNADEQD
jgi:hypothetical protein